MYNVYLLKMSETIAGRLPITKISNKESWYTVKRK